MLKQNLPRSSADLETAPLLSHASTAAENDEFIVTWDGSDDPENPLNWSRSWKWTNVLLLSFMTFLTPFASSMFAPGVPQVMRDFKSDNMDMASFIVSVYVLGYAFGPLVIAPMSELYGRNSIYYVSAIFFLIFSIGCAWSTGLVMLTAFRFLAGVAGCCPLTVGSGTIADTFKQEERGKVMGIWMFSILFGPCLGPVIGAYVAEVYGWRWDFYILAICTGIYLLLALALQRESYPPLLLEIKTTRLRRETGNPKLQSALASRAKSPRDLFVASIIRPIKLLFLSPIVFGCSLYVAVGYGYLYLVFTTITMVFMDQYGISRSKIGLVFLGIAVGQFISLLLFSKYPDALLKKLAKGGEMKPEYRLPLLWPGAVLVPVGLVLYGWTVEYNVHFMVPILGTGLVGAGMIWTFVPIGVYLVDAYPKYPASATAASTVFRSIGGALLPLAGRRMYAALGLGMGNTLLAAIAVAMTPMIWIFLRYGEALRKNSKLQLEN